MARVSPTAEGFRAAFRRPSFTFAEITWRWCVGATASALFFFGLLEYLRTLPVNGAELLFLRTRQPVLVGQAIAHILRGTLDRAVLSGMVAAIALLVLWVVAASIGRKATVQALLHYFRRGIAGNVSPDVPKEDAEPEPDNRSALQPLMGLNFLRAAVILAAIVGLQGVSILSDLASPDAHPEPALAALVFFPLVGMVLLFWCVLNWFLSLAAIFVVRDGEDTLGALSAAATLCRERSGAVLAVSSWNAVAHFALFIGATIVVSFPLGLASILPGRLVFACVVFITLLYFAVVDWFYTARLAGYVCILETPQELLAPPPLPTVPPPSAPPLQTTIDRDEPILSDVPLPLPQQG